MSEKNYMEKKPLDELIRITRKYWETGDVDILDAKINHAKKLSVSVSGNENRWCMFSDLIFAIIRLNKETTNLDIYGVLETLGYYLHEMDCFEQPKMEEKE
jgi:hypothetical protein